MLHRPAQEIACARVRHCVKDERVGSELSGDPKPAGFPPGHGIFSEEDDLLIEPAHFLEHRALVEDVARLVTIAEFLQALRDRPVSESRGRIGKGTSLDDADRCVLESSKTCLQPSGVGQAVIVRERDDRSGARPPGQVPSSPGPAIAGVAHNPQIQPCACHQIGEHGLGFIA